MVHHRQVILLILWILIVKLRKLPSKETSFKESKVSGDKREIGQAFMNLGGVYVHLNDNQKAVDNWKESLKWFREAGYDQGIAYINDNLGVITRMGPLFAMHTGTIRICAV